MIISRQKVPEVTVLMSGKEVEALYIRDQDNREGEGVQGKVREGRNEESMTNNAKRKKFRKSEFS